MSVRKSKNPKIGIYKIENKINHKRYIGQTHDMEMRFKEHINHRNCKNASIIDKEIGKYGIENFSFEPVIYCDESQLDKFESEMIKFFRARDKEWGYNILAGGKHNIGESNPRAKLTEKDIYNIRESYNNHEYLYDVYDRYKEKISRQYFLNIWEGYIWKNIHMDVYTPENKKFSSRHYR